MSRFPSPEEMAKNEKEKSKREATYRGKEAA